MTNESRVERQEQKTSALPPLVSGLWTLDSSGANCGILSFQKTLFLGFIPFSPPFRSRRRKPAVACMFFRCQVSKAASAATSFASLTFEWELHYATDALSTGKLRCELYFLATP